MEKYIVMVNHKYLVSVEANSRGGAEHRILDLVYGIEYAQAFSREDLRTEFFRDNAFDCETISFEQLKEKSETIHNAIVYENNTLQTIHENEKKIRQLRKELELLEHNTDILRENVLRSRDERKNMI